MYSFFFAAGIAGFAYTKVGSRLGYGNAKSVWMFVGFSFVLSFLFFYTFITYVVRLQ